MRRAVLCAAAVAAIAGLTVPLAAPLPVMLAWNASPSLPTGLYAVHRGGRPVVGVRLAVSPPPDLAMAMARRGTLPLGSPLIKRLAATGGAQVCRRGLTVTIDGRFAAMARVADRHGRPLPAWQGCRRLAAGEVFLLNPAAPDSFDGRYFGPLPASRVLGRAQAVWTDEAGDGHHQWFAPPEVRVAADGPSGAQP